MFEKLNRGAKFIQSRKRHFLSGLRKSLYSDTLPTNPFHDDLYLVSFPKSGVTWLSFLMANVNVRLSDVNRQVTFFNANDFVPDIHVCATLSPSALAVPGHRCIKSHSGFNPFYNKILYLIRDPRDVMVSYYWFLSSLGQYQGGISELIRSKKLGIDAWCDHVEGWVERSLPSQSINFFRYEDMKADVADVITRIYSLLGITIPAGILEQSIESSSFENMKKSEDYYNEGGAGRFPGHQFVRKGESGAFRAELSSGDEKHVVGRAAKWLERFGYVLANSA